MTFLLALVDVVRDSQVGGLPHLEEWPKKDGKLLTPLLELGPELLRPAGFELPEGACISVSADLSERRGLAISDVGDVAKLDGVPALVSLGRRTQRPLVDRKAPSLRYPAPCGLVLGPEREEPTEPMQCSKIGGAPGWIQDEIRIEDHRFALQISGMMLAMAGAKESPFGDGLGYLFLAPELRPGAVGHFFIQFS